MRWTEEQLADYQRSRAVRQPAAAPAKSRNKYGAKPTEVDGIKFASKAEATRYSELKELERIGLIWDLRLHVEYPLIVNGQKVGKYTCDSEYMEAGQEGGAELITEDVKGRAARDWPLRKRLFAALYGRKVREINNGRKR